MNRPALGAAGLLLMLALLGSPASACQYTSEADMQRAMEQRRKRHPSLEVAFDRAARVLRARVVHQQDEPARGNQKVSLEVLEVFKGPSTRNAVAYTRPLTSCMVGIVTHVGREGIFFIDANGFAHPELQPLDAYPDRPETLDTLRRLGGLK